MTVHTEHPYVVREEGIFHGEPVIKGTRTPVRSVVVFWQMRIMPEGIPKQLPHLSLAAVFDALSYYEDHQAEIEDYIKRTGVPQSIMDAEV